MTDNSKLNVNLIDLETNILKLRIDTQVILQLLVKKNIVTAEEVADMRNYVQSQPKYKKLTDAVNAKTVNVVDELLFEQLFSKMLSDPKSLSDEEREYLLSKVGRLPE